MNEPNIKGVIFDLGGVILTRWNTDDLHDYASGLFGVEKERYRDAFNAEINALQGGEITDLEFWKRVCRALDAECPPDDVLDNILPDVYKRTVKTDEKMVKLIKGLKANGYKLGLISNTIEDHARVYRNFGILELFDEVVLSHEVKLFKPEPEIYNITLERIELAPEETVFIDDLQPNIDGAEEVGMNAILFSDAEQLKSELQKLGVKV